jgi:hypothetical protein
VNSESHNLSQGIVLDLANGPICTIHDWVSGTSRTQQERDTRSNFMNLQFFQMKLISLCKVLSAVSDDPLQSLHPCQETILEFFNNKLIREFCNRIQNFVRALHLPIRHSVLEYSKGSEVTRAQVWWIDRVRAQVTFASCQPFVIFVLFWHIELSLCPANSVRVFRRANGYLSYSNSGITFWIK